MWLPFFYLINLPLQPEPHHTNHEYALLFQQGDEQALAFFYREFHAALALYAFRWVENIAIAEEIASDAFIKTWKMHWKLDNYYAIRSYLYKTVLRDSQRVRRQELKRATLSKDSILSNDLNGDTPIDHLLRIETYRIIHRALEELSPGTRRVLTMHFIEGKTTREIATELKLSPSTIKTQKAKGLESLRKKLLRPSMILFSLLANGFSPLL